VLHSSEVQLQADSPMAQTKPAQLLPAVKELLSQVRSISGLYPLAPRYFFMQEIPIQVGSPSGLKFSPQFVVELELQS